MIIAVDPSIRSCGVAMYRDGAVREFGVVTLATTPDDYPIRATVMAATVANVIIGWGHNRSDLGEPINAIIETPVHWHTGRGLKSEASEDIQKLYWFVGMLIGRILIHMSTVSVVRPNVWKGSQPKDVMVHRALKHLHGYDAESIKYLPHDAFEAVGLAVWLATTESAFRRCTVVKPDCLSVSPTVTIASTDENPKNSPFVSCSPNDNPTKEG